MCARVRVHARARDGLYLYSAAKRLDSRGIERGWLKLFLKIHSDMLFSSCLLNRTRSCTLQMTGTSMPVSGRGKMAACEPDNNGRRAGGRAGRKWASTKGKEDGWMDGWREDGWLTGWEFHMMSMMIVRLFIDDVFNILQCVPTTTPHSPATSITPTPTACPVVSISSNSFAPGCVH